MGDKRNVQSKPTFFNDAGFVFVSVNYRLSPKPVEHPDPNRIKWPIHPQDVSQALHWFRSNAADFCSDPERIGLLGHSAGAGVCV